MQRRKAKGPGTISAPVPVVNWKIDKLTWAQGVEQGRGLRTAIGRGTRTRGAMRAPGSAAGDAHVAAHAWPVVAAIYDEVVALGLLPDGAVDGVAEQRVVA